MKIIIITIIAILSLTTICNADYIEMHFEDDNTTFISWNYIIPNTVITHDVITHDVPISTTIWLVGSGMLCILGINRNRYK